MAEASVEKRPEERGRSLEKRPLGVGLMRRGEWGFPSLFGRHPEELFSMSPFTLMRRLTEDTLARCREILEGRPVLVKSHDPRLRAQRSGVVFGE